MKNDEGLRYLTRIPHRYRYVRRAPAPYGYSLLRQMASKVKSKTDRVVSSHSFTPLRSGSSFEVTLLSICRVIFSTIFPFCQQTYDRYKVYVGIVALFPKYSRQFRLTRLILSPTYAGISFGQYVCTSLIELTARTTATDARVFFCFSGVLLRFDNLIGSWNKTSNIEF